MLVLIIRKKQKVMKEIEIFHYKTSLMGFSTHTQNTNTLHEI